jgi:DNA-binding transcriptional ArsR family regulator
MPDDRMRELKADLLKALAQPTRLKILERLVDGERCVWEIFPTIRGEQPNTSKHLSFLRSHGIVISERRGMRVFNRLADKKIARLLDDVDACAQLDLAADISHVSDVKEIAALGVLRTPTVIVDGKIVGSGRMPTVGELRVMLSEAQPIPD